LGNFDNTVNDGISKRNLIRQDFWTLPTKYAKMRNINSVRKEIEI